MAKAKRYDEGGVTEGKNAGIDDDTRARAMKYVQEQSEKGSEDESSGEKTVSRSTKSKVSTKPAAEKTETKSAETPRMRTKEEIKDAIPTGGKKGAGPTESKGNSASGSELERNLSAAANTFAPAGSKIVKGGAATVRGVKELVDSRKAAKTAQAAREAKTLNPAAWMAGPKGMKENFKSGGGVKGWGIARGSRKAKTY